MWKERSPDYFRTIGVPKKFGSLLQGSRSMWATNSTGSFNLVKNIISNCNTKIRIFVLLIVKLSLQYVCNAPHLHLLIHRCFESNTTTNYPIKRKLTMEYIKGIIRNQELLVIIYKNNDPYNVMRRI